MELKGNTFWVVLLFSSLAVQICAIGPDGSAVKTPPHFVCAIYAIDTEDGQQTNVSGPYCSASLITNTHVLTSGLCLNASMILPPRNDTVTPTTRIFPYWDEVMDVAESFSEDMVEVFNNATELFNQTFTTATDVVSAFTSPPAAPPADPTSTRKRTVYVACGLTSATTPSLANLTENSTNPSGVIVSDISTTRVVYYTPNATEFPDGPAIITLNRTLNSTAYTPLTLSETDIRSIQKVNNSFDPLLFVRGWGDPTCGRSGAAGLRQAYAGIYSTCQNFTYNGATIPPSDNPMCVVYYNVTVGKSGTKTTYTATATKLSNADQGTALFVKLASNLTIIQVGIASLEVQDPSAPGCTKVGVTQPVLKVNKYMNFIKANVNGTKWAKIASTTLLSQTF